MWLRRKRARPEVAIEGLSPLDESVLPLDFKDSGPSPEESCLQRERERILFAAMNDLTPGIRTAIQLRELDELSTEETARAMGLSTGAVKARVFHGRRRLRERLKHYCGSAWTSGRNTSRTIADTTHLSQERLTCNACGYNWDERSPSW